MAGRRLSPEETEIWTRLAASVTPLPGKPRPAAAPREGRTPAASPLMGVRPAIVEKRPPAPRMPSPVLDDSWERRIARGTIVPDMMIDLHGHSLDAAHRRLSHALSRAVAQGARVLLVVTGNPRPASAALPGQKARGAIRAEIGDWLALGGHADAIASVRTAHPRHGGKGALYIILRRRH